MISHGKHFQTQRLKHVVASGTACARTMAPTRANAEQTATTVISFSCAPARVSERGIARSEQGVRDISRQTLTDSEASLARQTLTDSEASLARQRLCLNEALHGQNKACTISHGKHLQSQRIKDVVASRTACARVLAPARANVETDSNHWDELLLRASAGVRTRHCTVRTRRARYLTANICRL